MTFYVRPLDHEVLLALAWAAPLTTHQLRRLAAPWLSRRAFSDRLQRLQVQEVQVLQRHRFYQPVADKPPLQVGWVWSLTPAGWQLLSALGEQVAEQRQQPPQPASIRQSLLVHDLQLSELVVCLVERARGVLTGLYLDREIRLDDQCRRPICDAILIIRRSPTHALPATVPWLTGPPAPEEAIRGYAVEIDRNTEAIGIIREKAVAYSALWRDSAFYQRYGRFPVPLWLVPKQRRLEAIMAAWSSAWPDGKWLIATDAGLQQDAFEEWQQGRRRCRTLLDGWELQPHAPADEAADRRSS